MEETPQAAPSAAPTPTEALASLSEMDRREYEKTGEFPKVEATPSTEQVESSPTTQDEDPAASTEVITEPVPATGKPKRGAESRKEELAAEIQGLLARRAALRVDVEHAERAQKPAEKAAPSVTITPPEQFPDYATWLDKNPNGLYESYLDARADFRVENGIKAQRAQDQQRREYETRQQQVQSRVSSHGQRFEAAKVADATFVTKLSPAIGNLVPLDFLPPNTPPTQANVIAQEIMMSEKGPQLMVHLSEHPEILAQLSSYPTYDAIIRHMGRLEASLDAPKATVPLKTVTSAPSPPTLLGSRPTETGDESLAALAAKDFSRYAETVNRRELAAKR